MQKMSDMIFFAKSSVLKKRFFYLIGRLQIYNKSLYFTKN